MEKRRHIQSFDFDLWSRIAEEDPKRFEEMRADLLEQMIEQSPDSMKQRMQGLQWRVEQVRIQSANPMAACLRISKMMWNSLLGEQGLLTALATPEKILRKKNDDKNDNKVIPSHKPGKKP